MTPYHETFIPIFLLGCLVAAIASFLAGRAPGCLVPAVLLCISTVTVWGALFVGSDMGYRAWQSMPDPPAEAFSDASVMGALLFGWFPGVLFSLTVFVLVRGILLLWHEADSKGCGSDRTTYAELAETGNPYQSPPRADDGRDDDDT